MNPPAEDFPLPELRSDLQLIEGPVALDGSPSWIIFDPLRNKYFSIGWTAFQLLSRWSIGKANALIQTINKDTAANIDSQDVQSILGFLYSNSLTRYPASGSSQDYLEQYEASKPNFFIWLIHNYLFVKFPLVKPTAFLRRTLVFVEPVFSRTAFALVITLGLIGLYMIGRQWDSFTSTFLYFFNMQGLLFYFLSLIFIKVLHELAHAYTVIRYGCRVPTMGVALLVMFPILYTDTSDTWRLQSAKERVHVGAAGMLMEFYVACLATFSWSFLPDGFFKSAAFILATTSWVLSLAINLNGMMRFDGYYILSDLLGIQNLQKRSFDVGKWRLTEWLFGLGLPAPEALPRSMLTKLTIYAWCVWVYRFFLFIGIALLVYYFFFKVLGILLFAIEILWFIVLPVVGLFRGWWEMRASIIKTKRFYITLSVMLLALALFLIPWNTSIAIPAIYQSQQKLQVFTPTPAYIEQAFLENGKAVKEGDVLLQLRSPQIEHDIKLAQGRIDYYRLQAKRIAASEKELSNVQVIIRQLQERRSELLGLYEEKEKLTIRAPFDGVVFDVEPALHSGRWINQSLPLATLIQPTQPVVEAVMFEKDLPRVSKQAQAMFIPDNPQLDSIWLYVKDVELANMKTLDLPALSSIYGGKVPSQFNQDNQLIPDKSLYRVRLGVSEVEQASVQQMLRGVVHIQGEAESFIKRFYKLVVSVLIRESGF